MHWPLQLERSGHTANHLLSGAGEAEGGLRPGGEVEELDGRRPLQDEVEVLREVVVGADVLHGVAAAAAHREQVEELDLHQAALWGFRSQGNT